MPSEWKNGPSDACMFGYCEQCGREWAEYLSECELPWDKCGYQELTPADAAIVRETRERHAAKLKAARVWRQGFLY